MSKENRVSDELLPCPFCGGTAKLSNYRVAEDAMGCHVACTKCLVQTDVFEDAYTPFEQAIRAWNTRSKPVAGVEVKPLEWHGPDVNGDIHARSILAVYTIRKKQGSLGYWLTEVGGYHSTIEKAKAAAEGDYRNRIMSALLPKATAPLYQEKLIEELSFCLQWMVDNDETDEGDELNEYWIEGLNRARSVLSKASKSNPNTPERSDE